MTGLFGTTPGEWRWAENAMSNGVPQSSDWRKTGLSALVADGSLVCWFGDSEQYYPTEGIEPSDADKRAFAQVPAMLELVATMNEGGFESVKWIEMARQIKRQLEEKQ